MAGSSAGSSNGLLNRGSWVRSPPRQLRTSVLTKLMLEFVVMNILMTTYESNRWAFGRLPSITVPHPCIEKHKKMSHRNAVGLIRLCFACCDSVEATKKVS